MSEAMIAELTRQRDNALKERDEARGEAKKYRLARKDANVARDQALADLDAVTKERDTLKAAKDATPGEQSAELERLRGELLSRDHRDAWSVVKGQLADKVSIEKVWAEIGYKPGEKLPTPEQITEQLGQAREAAPYLFKPADAANDDPGGSSGSDQPPAERPGPGFGRGAPSNDAGFMKVRRADLSDPEWMKRNQSTFAKASEDNRVRFVD